MKRTCAVKEKLPSQKGLFINDSISITQQGYILKSKYIKPSFLIPAAAMLYAVIAVIIYPVFRTDDLLLFYIIKFSKGLVSNNSSEDFFLFYRPLSFIYFKLTYFLSGENAAVMKLFNIALFTVYSIILVKIFESLSSIFKLENTSKTIIIASGILILSPDTLQMIIWIANTNELLMCLCYACALYVFLKFGLNTAKHTILFWFFYFLSIGFKQQSLHLPILIGMLMLLPQFSATYKKSRAYAYIAAGLIVSAGVSLFYSSSGYDSGLLLASLWKKPFSLFGTGLFIVFPLGARELYNYFLLNKSSVALFLIVIIPAIYYLVKLMGWRKLLLGTLLILVVFFPRILGYGGERINSIQLLWFSIAVYLILSRYTNHKLILTAIASILVIVNLSASVVKINDFKVTQRSEEKKISEIASIIGNNPNNFLLVSTDNFFLFNYQYYYYMNAIIGKSDITCTPLKLEASYLSLSDAPFYSCRLTADTLTANNTNPLATLYFDTASPNFEDYKIISFKKNRYMRDNEELSFRIPAELMTRSILYHDGVRWQRLK